MSQSRKLDEIFGGGGSVIPEVMEFIPSKEITTTTNKENTEDDEDIERVKKIHYDLIQKSEKVLDELMEFAISSESPKAYEAISELIKTSGMIAKNLADIALKNKQSNKTSVDASTNTQNNIFMGSTAELQKFLKRNKEENA